MLRTLLLLLLPCFFLLAEDDIIPYMTSECDTYALVDGVVNAHNGKLVQIDQDIKTGGVDPVEMVRYYDGGHHFHSQFGYGVGCSYPALLKADTGNKNADVTLELRQGLEVLCELTRRKDLETKKTGPIYTGSLAERYYKKGYTNCPAHLLQGEPSLFALHIELDSWKAVVTLGDGTKRHYVYFQDNHYRLVEEVLPSGNRRHFFYTRNYFPFSLKDICTTNADRTLNLNWLNFTDTIADTKVVASNGQQTTYKFQRRIGIIQKGNLFRGQSRQIESDLLFQVHADNYPHTEYQSITHSKTLNNVFSVYQVHWANRVLEVEYDGHERVKILKSAASSIPLYTFHYRDHSTDVTDANGAIKTYSFSNRRPVSFTEPHRTQNYHWDEKGQLISHTIHTPDGTKHFEQNYCYDLTLRMK